MTVLSQAGAIIFAKTNIPQTLLSFECSNPVFGTTFNPYPLTKTGEARGDKATLRTSGGSSGGDGSLLGSDAAVLGESPFFLVLYLAVLLSLDMIRPQW